MNALSVVATALACLYLPVPFIMMWFHALDGAWKRLGAWSYALHVPLYLAMVAGTAALHDTFRASAWPWHPAASAVGVVVVAAAFALLFSTRGHITLGTLIAYPQVTRSHNRDLIDSGVYDYVRHPRYAALIAGSFGNFLLTGYELLLAAFCVTTAATIVATRLEERELIEHFGLEYIRYRDRVPAFVPRPR